MLQFGFDFQHATPPATELSTTNKLKEQLGKVVADNVLKKALKTYMSTKGKGAFWLLLSLVAKWISRGPKE